MFSKKSQADVRKSSLKITDSRKDSSTRLKHLKIVLEHFDAEESKSYFENNFSHVYFILYDNFIQAENNLRQRVQKAGREELEGALCLLEKVLCLLPELVSKRWQLHSLSRIFSKLLHRGNSPKLRAEAIRYFLLWYQALGENAPTDVHRMFAGLVPGLPDPQLLASGLPASPKPSKLLQNIPQETPELSVSDLMQHPNFSVSTSENKPESVGILSKLANVSASIFHDTNAMNPVQYPEILPLIPASSNEKFIDNETKFFLEILLDGMATSVTKIQWRDRSHSKAMRNFAFLLEKFKIYYLPTICPQFDHNNSLYKPNLTLPAQHNILDDEFVNCRVVLIKWVAGYAHPAKKLSSETGQPSSITSAGSHGNQHSGTPTPALSLQQEESETSFTVGQPDTSRASSYDSNTPHPSLDSATTLEEVSVECVVRDVLQCSREHVNFTIEVLRQAFLLPFAHSAAIRRVIALYKDWIQMSVADVPVFLLENEQQEPAPAAPPRRLRTDSYLGAIHKDNLLVRAGLQNMLQVFMTQAANVFVASQSPVAPPGTANQQHLLEEQTDTCKRVLNIYRYMVMHTAMDANTWEQLLLVLLQITSLVLTKIPPKRKQETLGGALAPAIFQTLIVTWIKANLNVAVRPELWQSFMDVLTRLTHWEELIKEWAKTMETLTRVLARHVYSLDLSEVGASGGGGGGGGGAGDGRGRGGARRVTPAAPAGTVARPAQTNSAQSQSSAHDGRTPGKSPKSHESRRETAATRRHMARCRSDTQLDRTRPSNATQTQDETKELECSKLTRLTRARRCYSLDSLRARHTHHNRDSESGSRSPSPAPSSGVESSSIKDSPLQIDLASDGGHAEWSEGEVGCAGGEEDGVVLGGTARGWLRDVAAVMWRRMLAALGNPNRLKDPAQHAHVFHYLLHLNATLVKISANQSLIDGNTETHVPFNLVAGWCLEAEALPATHRQGKLLALRLLCEAAQAAPPPPACAARQPAHVHLYQRALHHGLTGEDRSVVDVLVKHAAPRHLSLALDGYSLLLLDFVHASTIVLNSSDITSCPRTEAVIFLGSLLSLPDELISAPMLQAYPHQYNTVSCPDLKEHVLNILVRVCRRERACVARCAGACALAAHVCRMLAARAPCPRLPQYVGCLLQMLTMKNESIAKVVSDIVLTLADYTDRIIALYPGLADKIVLWICACLAQLSNTSWRDSAKPLAGSLLLCLAEFCVRMGPTHLLVVPDGNSNTLLLTVFKVLYAVMKGANGSSIEGLMLPLDEDFDPNVHPDNLGPKATHASTIDVKLWAQMICTQLVLFLGHWPLSSNCQLSSSVSEHHDGGPTLGSQLDTPVLSAPHIQLMRLGRARLAAFVELHALGASPGLVTSERQVRVITRDLAGKACWDASALYYDPLVCDAQPLDPVPAANCEDTPLDDTLSSLPPPYSPDQLPDYTTSPPDKHHLDRVLAYIGHTSPEVTCGRRLDEAGPSPLPAGAEDELIAQIVAHCNAERQYLAKMRYDGVELTVPAAEPRGEPASPPQPFQQCRLLLSQLGTLAPARRTHAHLMKRSDRLLRELRNLDAQRCRETHKIAVIYVGKGQETRQEILSNRCGSPAYEAFLAALAWEVELESHVGFAGGLQRGGGGGTSAPYLATLTLEALFHVATRMPADSPDALLNKTRHLGNDEVHVVWSEHWRAYRRDTLPTQFCDVLIALYPLPGALVRVTVARKPHVPVFGPLPDESIVHLSCAAALVRGAAFAGGRAVRATMPLYQHAYSERARSMDAVLTHHTLCTTFEEFVERVREPVPRGGLLQDKGTAEQGSTRLAAALLDHTGAQHASVYQPAAPTTPQISLPESHGISPKPVKRLGPFKRPQHAPPPEPQGAPASPPAPTARRNR